MPAQVYNVTRYSTEDGLIQSQVRTILQDSQGYLWFGTHRGVSRFDSRQFQALTPQKDNLAGNFLTALCEDQLGRIWMASENGLSVYDRKKITNYTSARQLGEVNVLSMCLDNNNRIWIGKSTGGVTLYDKETFAIQPFPWEGDPNRSVEELTTGMKDTVWLGTDAGLFVFDGKQIIRPRNLPPELKGEILSILQDSDGHLWVGTTLGVSYRTSSGWQLINTRQGLPNATVYCLVQDHDGVVWAGTGNGIAHWTSQAFEALRQGDRSLDYQIRSACVDREGNLWFGTEGGGIRKISQGIFKKYNMETGLSSNLAKSFLEDAQGRLWISTLDQGITLFQNERFVGYITEKNGLGDKDISYSYRDRQGNLWFCSYDGGISRYDGQKFHVLRQEYGLLSNAIFCVEQVGPDTWWIGGQGGISVFDGKKITRVITPKDGLLGEAVYQIRLDSQGRIWVGTGSGVCRLEAAPVSAVAPLNWHIYTAPKEVGGTVISILEDRQQRLWFGTGNGLYEFEQDTFRQINLSSTPGASAVVSLVQDPDYLWVGTENGIYRLHFDQLRSDTELHFDHFTQKDGLPSLECNGNAAYLDSHGNIWFGTSEGAIRRPPGAEQADSVPPPMLHITRVRPANDVMWEELGVPTDLLTGLPVDLELSHAQNRLGFDFIAITYKSSQQVEYRYKLKGLDEGWSAPTRETSVSYSNLRAGDYSFLVTARNESQNWDYDRVATFNFRILKPFYSRWWFILLAIAVVAISGWAIYRNITLERRRETEARNLRDRAEKLQLEQQALYAMMNPHFTFNALQSIQFFIHKQDKIQANKFLSSFAKLVRKNLESTQSEFIPLSEEVERLQLYLSLEKMRFQEKFTFTVEVDPEIDDHRTLLLPMILQPFVENSIRHGIMPLEANGHIYVGLRLRDDEYLECVIRDNGIGLEASKKMKENRPNDHVSRGMQITLDRLSLFARMTQKEHRVDIHELTDDEGKVIGTEVVMVMPLKLNIPT